MCSESVIQTNNGEGEHAMGLECSALVITKTE